MSQILVFRNATVFDSTTGKLLPGREVRVDGGAIAAVVERSSTGPAEGAAVYDLAGRVLLPGLIDAHVHATATIADFFKLAYNSAPTYVAAQAKDVLRGMLMRGFTTARDAAGADAGLRQAVAEDLFVGPRLFVAGQAISQTGGHGDTRPAFFHPETCACCALPGVLGTVADGVEAVRKAARTQFRRGADQIKVMASGGIASPTDPLEATQYSLEEMRAICEEAENFGSYVMAHAYTPRSIRRAVECGVRTIEHGNLLDAEAAAVMAERGAYLVPTLATYEALAREGRALGWSEAMLDKLALVRERGIEAIRHAKAAGAKIGWGTDLLGHMHAQQSDSLALALPAQSAAEILASATRVNAEMMGLAGKAGVVAAGAWADLIVVDGNPLEDIAVLGGQGERIRLIVKGGRIYKDELAPR